MGRNRVLSFMSQLSAGRKTPSPPSPPPSSTPPSDDPPIANTNTNIKTTKNRNSEAFPNYQPDLRRPVTPPTTSDYGSPVNSPPRHSPHQRRRSNSRPLSMVQAYQPPVMDVNEDTIPELQPIFSLLNSHANKLYHEGYFLKLDDQNTQGKPNPDRSWAECFAQLVGTVLSLWDAAELDAAGDNGEVLPKFINLTDASIKMIESLPTRSNDGQPLQNILSLSTAGRNRYLLHFNSHDSLVEWTAAIRLAMYEHSTLQEAYTGALIAGKAKSVNNINIIMERSRFKTEEWVRVRFGAGVPWRRCWCVITPPDEKEYSKLQKELKKRSPYDRSPVPVLKGDIKFYDTKTEGKKQKKVQPIASITDAYSAYAIYPQAKSLIDASTLIKVEGNIAIHTSPSSSSEGFVFMMPETRPAVSGFETMLSFLFPAWDTFGLYGRPGKLIASVLDSRSLMFAMPRHRRYGYLELQDVTGLLVDEKCSAWKEREWRRRLKEATGTRMNSTDDGARSHSRSASRISARLSFGNGIGKQRVGFPGEDDGSQPNRLRSHSESNSPDRAYSNSPSQLEVVAEHGLPLGEGLSSDDDRSTSPTPPLGPIESMRASHTPEPVVRPPAFNHSSHDRPSSQPYHSPELRQANSRLSTSTLAQMAKAGGLSMHKAPNGRDGVLNGPAVPPHRNSVRINDDGDQSHDALGLPNQPYSNGDRPISSQSHQQAHSPYAPDAPDASDASFMQDSSDSRPHTSEGRQLPFVPGHNPGSQSQDHQYAAYRPGAGPQGSPLRKPLPVTAASSKHQSLTPNDIIDHYTTQSRAQYDNSSMPPPPPPHHQLGGFDGQSAPYDEPEYSRTSVERPRAGVLKTVGGAEAPQRKSEFDIPDIDFGPTINYGATPVMRKRVSEDYVQRPYTPTNRGPRPQSGHRRQESSTIAWSPAASPSGPRPQGLTAEQFVQQRAAVATSPYGHGRKHSTNTLGGRSPSPSMGSSRSISPQPMYQPMGSLTGGQPGSFSQPLRSGAESPSRGHYTQNQSSIHPQYQSQAF